MSAAVVAWFDRIMAREWAIPFSFVFSLVGDLIESGSLFHFHRVLALVSSSLT